MNPQQNNLPLDKTEISILLPKIAAIMRDFKPFWAIAGGWAIDLHIGEMTRPHEDIEITVFRQEQIALQEYFKDWKLQKAVAGELIDWNPQEFLEPPIHVIFCTNEEADPKQIEALLNERNENEWIYRRNEQIRKPIDKIYLTTEEGVRYLSPEIALLYKSKNPREKDEKDLQSILNFLDHEQKGWLRNALTVCYSDHHWMKNL